LVTHACSLSEYTVWTIKECSRVIFEAGTLGGGNTIPLAGECASEFTYIIKGQPPKCFFQKWYFIGVLITWNNLTYALKVHAKITVYITSPVPWKK